MESDFTIRRGHAGDAAGMAAIYNHYVAESDVIFSNTQLTAADMQAKIARLALGDRFPFLVAESAGRIVGYAYAHHWQPDPVYDLTWELTMYLAHDILGHGLGSRMLERLVDECRCGGAHVLVSCITEGNAPCERMHLRAGFTRAGCIPETGFKFGRFLNDVIYYRLL